MRRSTLSPFRSTLWLFALAALVGTALPAAAESGSEIGHVVAVDGRATATIPGRAPRPLACDDPIYAGERLATEPGARLVVARDGRHVHLGPEGLLVLRDVAEAPGLIVLLRGRARVIDARDLPGSRVASVAGALSAETADLELARLADGDLKLCDWSQGVGATCRRVDRDGRVWPSAEEGPRLDLGIRDLCPWSDRGGLDWRDFGATPPVASGPTDPPFEPEFDPDEPGCSGDECPGGPEVTPDDETWTVAPPVIFIP